MHQAILLHTNINKSTETCKVGYDTRHYHAYMHVFNAVDIGKLKLLRLTTRI